MVGGQNLLRLLGCGNGTRHGSAVSVDVDLILGLEFLGKMVNECLVEVSATEVAIPSGRFNSELSLLELDDGDGVVAMANIDKADTAGLLLWGGKVKLRNTPAEGGGCGIIHETEDLEAGNFRGVEECPALDIGEPGGDAHAEIRDGQLELSGGGLLNLAQKHGDELSSSEFFLVAKVRDLCTNLPIDIGQRGCDVLLFGLNIGVVEGATRQALEAGDGVLEVGNLLRLGRLAKVAGLGTKSYNGPIGDERMVSAIILRVICWVWRGCRKGCMEAVFEEANIRSSPVGDFIGDLFAKSGQRGRKKCTWECGRNAQHRHLDSSQQR